MPPKLVSFHKKSLDMGPILASFKKEKTMVKSTIFEEEKPLEMFAKILRKTVKSAVF